jgi:hypothetical protein
MVCDRVPPVEEVRLFQYSTNGEITSVGDEVKWSCSVGEYEDRCYSERMDQGVECGLASYCPIKRGVSLCELVQGMCDF